MSRIESEIVTAEYSAHHLQVLEGLEAVRKRPGMYIGSNGSPGLMHCLWEVIDNAVDEAVDGNGDKIDIILHDDGSVEVHDRGRGIPVDIEPRTGLSGVEVVFTKLHMRQEVRRRLVRRVGRSARRRRLGRERAFRAARRRGGPRRQGLRDVVPPRRTRDLHGHGEKRPDAPFRPFEDKSELRVIGKAPRGVTGTRIRYWADRQIFTKDAAFQLKDLETRARQTAFLVPGLEILVRDDRDRGPQTSPASAEGVLAPVVDEVPREISYRYEGGISEFVDYLATDPPVTDNWRIQGRAPSRRPSPCCRPTAT